MISSVSLVSLMSVWRRASSSGLRRARISSVPAWGRDVRLSATCRGESSAVSGAFAALGVSARGGAAARYNCAARARRSAGATAPMRISRRWGKAITARCRAASQAEARACAQAASRVTGGVTARISTSVIGLNSSAGACADAEGISPASAGAVGTRPDSARAGPAHARNSSNARPASPKRGTAMAGYFLAWMVWTIFWAMGFTRSRSVSSIRFSAAAPEGRPVRLWLEESDSRSRRPWRLAST